MMPILVDCDGAALPTFHRETTELTRLSLNHRGPEANVNLHLQSPSSILLAQVGARAVDLVRIAAYVYAADQSVSRGGEADAHGDNWSRDFTWCLPVDDLDPSETLGSPDGVYLFSGGMDSLCAVVESAAQLGKRPLLVSHSPAFNIASRQINLARCLKERFAGQWTFPLIRLAIHRSGSDASDYSQRTRSFLFASLGSVIAQGLGLGEVYLADNGVVSLNLPINGQLAGTKASRSTHPKFLRRFNRFIEAVLPDGPQVSKPLWDRTRAETLQILQGTNSVELLEETNSCAHGRYRTRLQAHCGVCSQCIDRRFATLAAGLEPYDPPERYEIDIFRQALIPEHSQTMALSYHRFATEVENMDELALFGRYSDLFECVDSSDPNPNMVAESLYQLIQRHAHTVLGVVAEQIADSNTELARQTLPPDCLLRLITGSRPTSVPGDTFRHTPDYRTVWLDDESFPLSTNQARVVELPDQSRARGVVALNQAYILEQLEISSQNLAQVFRGSDAWNHLVVRADGRGMYQLNLPPV